MEFTTPEEASRALAAKNGAEIDGRAIRLDFSIPRQRTDPKERASKHGDMRSAPSDTVFVANLDFDVDESILSAEAEKFGTIISLRLPTDRFEYPITIAYFALGIILTFLQGIWRAQRVWVYHL